jgi:hypothetical protein
VCTSLACCAQRESRGNGRELAAAGDLLRTEPINKQLAHSRHECRASSQKDMIYFGGANSGCGQQAVD